MRHGRSARSAGLLVMTLLLGSCSPGNNPGDVFPWAATTMSPTSGPDSFLLFPNPQKQDDGSLQTNTTNYATAYYEAIDPNNDKDTLAKWKAANGFDSGTGTQTWVVFGDVKDLGYGRRMTARQNTDGTVAVMVENYLVSPAANYTYSSFNLDAAVVSDSRWHVGTNGIDYSPPPGVAATAYCGNCYPKFFTFDPTTGQRLLEGNLDGRGNKAMPGICISCHGGRADPLTPATGSPTGKALFPLVGYSASQMRGDVEAHLQPLDVDSFGFSATPGYTRADQEAKLKTINKMVLCTYPLEIAAAGPEDTCRRSTNYMEWSSTPAATIIKQAYGGDGMLNDTFSDTYVPVGWKTPAISVDHSVLYTSVVVPACRTCHILRGTYTMTDLNFDNYCTESSPGVCDPAPVAWPYGGYFFGYADQIKHHVIDRGNMPLAKIVYQKLWSTSEADTLATFLDSAQADPVRDAGGAMLKPGRPVAVPGPNRTTISPASLSADGSLYASSYAWSVVLGTGVLSDPSSPTPTLTTAINGSNVLQLIVSNGTTQSDPVQVTVTIDNTMGIGGRLPANPVFANIKAVLQGIPGCYGCHYPGGGPPIFYTDIDRNGDSVVDSGTIGSVDDYWFYTELRGRINFTDVAASPLLRKPSGHHHGGGLVLNTADLTPCVASPGWPACQPYGTLGPYYAAVYNMFVNWILNGAPY